jgi:diguanylate cyclase (GGDEF)-like protein
MVRTVQRLSGLRVRFALAMGAFGIALGVLMGGVINWRLEEGLRGAAHVQLQAIAHELADYLSQSLGSRSREIALVADLVGRTAAADPLPIRHALDLVRQRQPAYAWIGITDTAGRVRVATAGLLEGVDVSARPWFAGGQRGSYLGDPHSAVLLAALLPPDPTGEPPRFVDVAQPLLDAQGRQVGVVGAHLHWSWLHRLMADVSQRHRGTSFDVLIADAQGRWLVQPPGETPPTLAGLREHGDGGEHFIGRSAVSGNAQGAGLGWTVVVRQRAEVAYAPLQAHRRFMLALTPLLALLFASGTWWIAGRVVRPVVRLAESARHLAASGHGDEASVVGQALDRLASVDLLTNVANRATLTGRLAELSRAAGQEAGLPARVGAAPSDEGAALAAMVLVNLDDFSTFNNSHGRDIGDQLLRAVSQRLSGCVRPQDLVARVGGDEFALLLQGLGRDAAEATRLAEAVAQRAEAACRAPIDVAGHALSRGVSVGVVVFAPAHTAPAELLKDAELTVREAKRLGGGRMLVFSDELHARFDARVYFEKELRAAIPGELLLHFQPQVDAQGRIDGAELLLRWQHPDKGMVPPGRFIPLAEETGLIIPIGQWIVEQACLQIKAWEGDPRRRHLVLSVNVSAREFAEPGYAQGVQRILERTGANPQRLKLELTESALAADVEDVVAKMLALKDLGVSFALDDFGTGFSSLSYLNRMPIDLLKIDQSFVREIDGPESDVAIVRAVIALGRGLGLEVIAEGVETETQHAMLAGLGCNRYQGYFFGRPMALAPFVELTARAEMATPDGATVDAPERPRLPA